MECLRGSVSPDKSLAKIYRIAEKTKLSKAEFGRLEERDEKQKELEYWKNLAQKTYTPSQLNQYRASLTAKYLPTFHSNVGPHGYFSNNYRHIPQHPVQEQSMQPIAAQNNQPLQHAQTVSAPMGGSYSTSSSSNNSYPPTPHTTRNTSPDILKATPYKSEPRRGAMSNPPNILSWSLNPFVNGTLQYNRALGLLCFRCEEVGHRALDCQDKK